jgi:hypothetical protein
MSLLDLRTDLRRMIGNPVTGDVPDATLTACLNKAQNFIASSYRFKNTRRSATFSTVIDQSRYGMPANVGILSVYDLTNHAKIHKVGWQALDDQGEMESASPLYYATFRNYIEFTPPPDAVITIRIRYKVTPTDMAADEDDLILPESWREMVKLYARYWYYEAYAHDFEKAEHCLNTYTVQVATIPDEMTEETIDADWGIDFPQRTNGASMRLDFDHSDGAEE